MGDCGVERLTAILAEGGFDSQEKAEDLRQIGGDDKSAAEDSKSQDENFDSASSAGVEYLKTNSTQNSPDVDNFLAKELTATSSPQIG